MQPKSDTSVWPTLMANYFGACLDVPLALPEAVEPQLVGNFSGVHGVGQILLVGENKEDGIPELVLVQHALQFLSGLRHTLPIVGIDDKDDTLSILEV